MSQFEEIPSPGRGFQGSRALGLAACKTLASKLAASPGAGPTSTARVPPGPRTFIVYRAERFARAVLHAALSR